MAPSACRGCWRRAHLSAWLPRAEQVIEGLGLAEVSETEEKLKISAQAFLNRKHAEIVADFRWKRETV